jgi:hypothetical protein
LGGEEYQTELEGLGALLAFVHDPVLHNWLKEH